MSAVSRTILPLGARLLHSRGDAAHNCGGVAAAREADAFQLAVKFRRVLRGIRARQRALAERAG